MLGSEGGAQACSSYSMLNVLYLLIQKSRVNEWLKARAEGKSNEKIEYVSSLKSLLELTDSSAGEIICQYGMEPLYHMLGYFSITGLLSVHVLLGDFTLALKVVENVRLNQKGSFTVPTTVHVSTAYHAGAWYTLLYAMDNS
jgi:translation initiation factor 3 subunit L